MGKLRSVWTAILLAACAGLAYQGYQNTRIPHPVDEAAEAVACDELQVCDGAEARWSNIDTSPFVRTYSLDAGRGAVTIECRWATLMFGEVTCRAEREQLAPKVEEKAVQRPHETRRGNR